jgi:NCAIR mutase (PurE)-related protein
MTGDRPSDRVLRDLMEALLNGGHPSSTPPREEQQIVADPGRTRRKGIPEVVFAPNKSCSQINQAVSQLLASNGRVVVSRVDEEIVEELRKAFVDQDVEFRDGSWTAVVADKGAKPRQTGGKVAIFAAGTSDWPAANEARILAEEMGCEVELVVDVGVAGLHRLFGPLRAILDREVDVIIVAAGMDGALPSVVAGLVPLPVIGLPTSVGYGYGGNGQAALMTMLQSCAPGLTVVNIDNAVGAGATAALIANGAARARENSRTESD